MEYQNKLWNNLVFFRDHLNSSEDARIEYLKVKNYHEKSSKGINEYTDHKEDFVKKIFNLRLKGV
ncbi:GrpB family protein [Mesobacillus subterraneus]|nr:GrpB family protein [Mesobacillus subterraneus]WLR57683.1 GrpB family protein [Mesobacillus subterraneus]